MQKKYIKGEGTKEGQEIILKCRPRNEDGEWDKSRESF